MFKLRFRDVRNMNINLKIGMFMSPNDLIEDKDMTVLNFMPSNCVLNAIFK